MSGPSIRHVRRVVTGEDAQGKSFVRWDGPAPLVQEQAPGLVLTDVWITNRMPVRLPIEDDPTAAGPLRLEAPRDGTTFRFCRFPPDREYLRSTTSHKMFDVIGGAQRLQDHAQADDAARHQRMVETYLRDPSRNAHPTMHRTETVDYAVVLSGEIWLVLDREETRLTAGDCVVQAGTNHAWSNRSQEPCFIVFIVLNARRGGSTQ